MAKVVHTFTYILLHMIIGIRYTLLWVTDILAVFSLSFIMYENNNRTELDIGNGVSFVYVINKSVVANT